MGRYRRGVSSKKRSQVFSRDDYRCVYIHPNGKRCKVQGGPFDYTYLTIEHIVPRGYGGSNETDNLETMCGAHNRLRDQEWKGLHGGRHRPREKVTFIDLVQGGHAIEDLFNHQR